MTAMTKMMATLIVAGAGAASALADGNVTINDATGMYDGSDGSGGAFQVVGNSGYNGLYGDNGEGANSFLSFCLERSEYLGFGGTYATQIATSAAGGGLSGGNPDPLSAATAKIYREFRAGGSFSGTDNFADGYNSSYDTTIIQYAIWALEGELTLGNDQAGLDAQALINWASVNDGALHGVRVLRLWDGVDDHGNFYGPHQDLLTLVPLPPAAWAGLGTLGGVAGLGFLRRRKLAAQ